MPACVHLTGDDEPKTQRLLLERWGSGHRVCCVSCCRIHTHGTYLEPARPGGTRVTQGSKCVRQLWSTVGVLVARNSEASRYSSHLALWPIPPRACEKRALVVAPCFMPTTALPRGVLLLQCGRQERLIDAMRRWLDNVERLSCALALIICGAVVAGASRLHIAVSHYACGGPKVLQRRYYCYCCSIEIFRDASAGESHKYGFAEFVHRFVVRDNFAVLHHFCHGMLICTYRI